MRDFQVSIPIIYEIMLNYTTLGVKIQYFSVK